VTKKVVSVFVRFFVRRFHLANGVPMESVSKMSHASLRTHPTIIQNSEILKWKVRIWNFKGKNSEIKFRIRRVYETGIIQRFEIQFHFNFHQKKKPNGCSIPDGTPYFLTISYYILVYLRPPFLHYPKPDYNGNTNRNIRIKAFVQNAIEKWPLNCFAFLQMDMAIK
jgi:hypothetical protein